MHLGASTPMEMNMKKLLATAALVTVIATPAFAQKVQHQRPGVTAQAAQTTQYGRTDARRHSTNAANDVFSSAGHYIGSDPDARVRMDMQRDHGYDD
jgi:Tfp pilus assembly protein FimT